MQQIIQEKGDKEIFQLYIKDKDNKAPLLCDFLSSLKCKYYYIREKLFRKTRLLCINPSTTTELIEFFHKI